jgi:hypothetical protein
VRDASAKRRQLNAARDFAKKIANALKNAASLRSALASKWIAPDLDFSLSKEDALKVRDEIIFNGYPPVLLNVLKKVRVDQKGRDQLIIELAKLPSGGLQKRFGVLLRHSKLRAAEVQLARFFERFSPSR